MYLCWNRLVDVCASDSVGEWVCVCVCMFGWVYCVFVCVCLCVLPVSFQMTPCS